MSKPQQASQSNQSALPARQTIVASPVSTPQPANRAAEGSATKYSLPHTQLDLSGLAQREKMEAWREHFVGLSDVSLHNLKRREFDASAEASRIGQVVLGRYSVTESGIRRTQKGLKVEREDLLVLRMHLSGRAKGIMDAGAFTMQPDRFTLFDFHQDYQSHYDNVDFISVTLPYASIGYDPTKHARLLQLPFASPVGRIIQSNLEMLLETIPSGSVSDDIALSDGFVGLMKGLIKRDLRDESVFQASVRAREVAIRRYVERHLRDPDLSAQSICEAVGVSRPVLYRTFSEEGGLRRAVTRMRLEGALETLAMSAPERGAISRISKHWCFHDQAHFTRLFRATFGFNPSEALASALNQKPAESADDTTDGARTPRPQLIDLYT